MSKNKFKVVDIVVMDISKFYTKTPEWYNSETYIIMKMLDGNRVELNKKLPGKHRINYEKTISKDWLKLAPVKYSRKLKLKKLCII